MVNLAQKKSSVITPADQNPDGSLNDMTFQDKVIEMIAPGHLNVYRYIGPPEGHETNNFPHDGLIRAPIGFYRLTEDMETGNKVLLFSYDHNALKGKERADGDRYLSSKNADTGSAYVIAARENIRDIRWVHEEMIIHQNTLQTWRLHHLNLYVESENMRSDQSIQEAEEEPKADQEKQIIKMSNSHIGYGLFEQEDGTWNVSLYVTADDSPEESEHNFVEISDDATFDGLFSLRQEFGQFDTLREAEKRIAEDFQLRAYRLWNGESALSAKEQPRITLQRNIMKILKAPTEKNWYYKASIPLIAGAVTGGIGFLISGGALAATGAVALVTGAITAGTGVYLNRAAEGFIEKALKKLMPEKSQEEKNKLLPKHSRKKAYLYTEELGQRLNPRLSAEKAPQLRVLKDRESSLRPVMTAPTLFLSNHYAEEWLFGSLSGAFGSIIYPVNTHSFSIQYPNGIVSLYNTDKKNVHVRLREDLKINNNEEIPMPTLPEEVDKLLKSGEILKISLSQGGFETGAKTYREFSEEIKNIVSAPVAGPDGEQKRPNFEQCKKHLKSYPLKSIKELFSAKAAPPADDDTPKTKPVAKPPEKPSP